MKKLFHFVFHGAIYVLLFLGLVWLLLGISPKEAYVRAGDNLDRLMGRVGNFSSNMGETVHDMRGVAGQHLQEAADRINGTDPYEKTAKKIDQSTHTVR